MPRAIILTCLLLVLGAPAWADGVTVGDRPACPDKQYVIDDMKMKYPGITYVVYTGLDGAAIKASIRGADATEFIVFKKPGMDDTRILVGIRDGCLEDSTIVPVRTLDRWLAGQEAGQ